MMEPWSHRVAYGWAVILLLFVAFLDCSVFGFGLRPPIAVYTRFAPRWQSSAGETLVAVSPSGIDAWPEPAQAAVFFGAFLALGACTLPATKALDQVSKVIGLEKWRINVIDTTFPILLGAFYLTAGAGHFLNADSFRSIYPPQGTWGLWFLPGSPAFHVAWAGIAELLGGGGLLWGGLQSALSIANEGKEPNRDHYNYAPWANLTKPVSALTLLVLTLIVTPSNIYMYTHGATFGHTGPLDVSFHGVRFLAQVCLLSVLFTLAKDSFFFTWGDELD